jgi:hypothetical protein
VVLSREDRFLPKMKFESIFFQVLGRFLETVINKRRLDGEWRCRKPNFPTGGVCSKKFEQISSKICRASGIPPSKKTLPPARRSDPFGPACLPAGRPAGRLDDFKFFIPLLAELRASLGLAAVIFI